MAFTPKSLQLAGFDKTEDDTTFDTYTSNKILDGNKSATITRSGGLISSIAFTDGNTYDISRDGDGLVLSVDDGTMVKTVTRTGGLISSITVS